MRRFRVLQLMGIPVRADLGWAFIALLFAVTLAAKVFPDVHPGLRPITYVAMGTLGTVGLFASILLHEFSHAIVAARYGIGVREIRLFVFGGIAELERRPESPRQDVMISGVGPLISFVAAALLFAARAVLDAPLAERESLLILLDYLTTINLGVAVFNAIPAFPLDGGRIARALLWQQLGSIERATMISSRWGQTVGVLICLSGVALAVFTGQLVVEAWLCLIGIYLIHAASAIVEDMRLGERLSANTVRALMTTNPVTVSSDITLRELLAKFVDPYHRGMFPVVDDGKLVGAIRIKRIREVPNQEWSERTVSSLMEPLSDDDVLEPSSDALSALKFLDGRGLKRALVVEDGRLVGVLSTTDLLEAAESKARSDGAKTA